MEKNVPIFVKIDDYKELLDVMDVMKQKLKNASVTLQKIKELKAEEDRELKDWEKNLMEVTKRVTLMDKTFFEENY